MPYYLLHDLLYHSNKFYLDTIVVSSLTGCVSGDWR